MPLNHLELTMKLKWSILRLRALHKHIKTDARVWDHKELFSTIEHYEQSFFINVYDHTQKKNYYRLKYRKLEKPWELVRIEDIYQKSYHGMRNNSGVSY